MAFRGVEDRDNIVSIKVIGVGGGGNNAVNRMIIDDVRGVEFVAVNTDKQALNHSQATNKVLIGENVTHGRGAGANPDLARRSAEESKAQLEEALKGAEMVVVTAGMGGGTGTGAAPYVAQVAKEMGILTVGVVTKPFAFEGTYKMKQAEEGIEQLLENVDSLIVIPNERLKLVTDQKITLFNAFDLADSILKQGVQSITDLISGHGLINLDFADVSTIMRDAGYAHLCVAAGKGKDKAETVARNAITSPLLETSLAGAKKVLINFTADANISLEDIDHASDIIREEADDDAEIIWGVILDENLEDELRIAVIATGFEKKEDKNDPFANISFTVPKTAPVTRPNIPAPETKDDDDFISAPKTTTTTTEKDSASETSSYGVPRQSRSVNGSTNTFRNSDKPRRPSTLVDDEDEDESFLKLLNDITKSK